MRIKIVSDTVCPWCFIGKRRFAQALAMRPDIVADIVWKPFELNPDLPFEGRDRMAHLTAKLGNDPGRIASIFQHIRQVGSEVGIDFRFDRIKKSPNTLLSHCLLYWAEAEGLQNRLAEALFAAFFERGLNIGDSDTLLHIATAAGLDQEVTRRKLEQRADLDMVRGQLNEARSLGVNGVPLFVFEERLAVSGAQASTVFLAAMDKLAG